jgi:hypothetical protein
MQSHETSNQLKNLMKSPMDYYSGSSLMGSMTGMSNLNTGNNLNMNNTMNPNQYGFGNE